MDGVVVEDSVSGGEVVKREKKRAIEERAIEERDLRDIKDLRDEKDKKRGRYLGRPFLF